MALIESELSGENNDKMTFHSQLPIEVFKSMQRVKLLNLFLAVSSIDVIEIHEENESGGD